MNQTGILMYHVCNWSLPDQSYLHSLSKLTSDSISMVTMSRRCVITSCCAVVTRLDTVSTTFSLLTGSSDCVLRVQNVHCTPCPPSAHSLTALLLQQWLIIMRLGSLSLWSLRENINNQQVSLVCLCWVQQIHFSFLRTLSLTMMNFVTSRFLINDCWHGWVRGEFY